MGTPTEPRTTREPLSAPQVVIYAPLEGRVRIVVDATRDGDFARLRDWLTHRPDIHRLVSDAIDLARQEQAA